MPQQLVSRQRAHTRNMKSYSALTEYSYPQSSVCGNQTDGTLKAKILLGANIDDTLKNGLHGETVHVNDTHFFSVPTITLKDNETCNEVAIKHGINNQATVTFISKAGDRTNFITDTDATVYGIDAAFYGEEIGSYWPHPKPCKLTINSEFVVSPDSEDPESTGKLSASLLTSKRAFHIKSRPEIPGGPEWWTVTFPPGENTTATLVDGNCVANGIFEYHIDPTAVTSGSSTRR